MPRPRFDRLPAAQQRSILAAALEEFSEHGFARASLNRIITASGTSKGSLYYCFDGKEDLYAHVIRDQIERLLADGGPLPSLEETDADGFWSTLEDLYLDLMARLIGNPQLSALLRDWLSGARSPAVGGAQHEAEHEMLPWLLRTVEAGQRAGAVRTDIPQELIVAVAMGLGQAMDVWLVTRAGAAHDLDDTVHTLMGMLRSALAPESPGMPARRLGER